MIVMQKNDERHKQAALSLLSDDYLTTIARANGDTL